jgi:hypothetical protein
VVATVLYAGLRLSPVERVRTVSRAALIGLAAGIAISIFGGDMLRLVLVTQLQTWRVLWLASMLALLVTPSVVPALWRGGMLARIALVALLAAFLMADERFALSSALLAAVLVGIVPAVKQELAVLRMVLFGMFAVLALALVINLGSSVLVSRALIEPVAVPDWLRDVRSFCGTGVLPALVLIAAGWGLGRLRPAMLAVAAAACGAFAIFIASAAFPQWAFSPYSASSHAAFAPWRARIPPGTEVLWFENPLATWTLLHRPDYASRQQGASALFSRDAAMVLRDRLLAIRSFGGNLESAVPRARIAADDVNPPSLAAMCGATGAGFVVTRAAPESQALETSPASLPPELRDWKLFACAPPPFPAP